MIRLGLAHGWAGLWKPIEWCDLMQERAGATDRMVTAEITDCLTDESTFRPATLSTLSVPTLMHLTT